MYVQYYSSKKSNILNLNAADDIVSFVEVKGRKLGSDESGAGPERVVQSPGADGREGVLAAVAGLGPSRLHVAPGHGLGAGEVGRQVPAEGQHLQGAQAPGLA